jgi:hypothetical protein
MSIATALETPEKRPEGKSKNYANTRIEKRFIRIFLENASKNQITKNALIAALSYNSGKGFPGTAGKKLIINGEKMEGATGEIVKGQAAEIALGHGCVFVCTVLREGRKGILLRQTCEPHKIGEPDPTWKAGKPYEPTDKDIIIWIDNEDGLRVLQDRVNIFALEYSGYRVMD